MCIMIYLITRHQGALEWFKKNHIAYDKHLAHLNTDVLQSGDQVIGNLPVNLIAQINKIGVSYFHLSFNVPYEWRGQELTSSQLDELCVEIKPYCVKDVTSPI